MRQSIVRRFLARSTINSAGTGRFECLSRIRWLAASELRRSEPADEGLLMENTKRKEKISQETTIKIFR
jgi:hypothetical protein